MNRDEMANMLNGRECGDEITPEIQYELNDSDMVVVFGASDDLMEFRGAIRNEVGAWEGGTAYLTSAGLLENKCDDDDCPYFQEAKNEAVTIKAVWDHYGYAWVYETKIPHSTFEIMEGDEKYCRGIVFYLNDVKCIKPS